MPERTSCIHSLEFVNNFSTAKIGRYNYLMSRFFNLKLEQFEALKLKEPWLDLEKALADAHIRYHEID